MPPRKTHRHPRLRGHGYDHGAYFVTLCTSARQHLFGHIVGTGPDAHLEPTDAGRLVMDEWFALPDHFKHLRLDQVQLSATDARPPACDIDIGPAAVGGWGGWRIT